MYKLAWGCHEFINVFKVVCFTDNLLLQPSVKCRLFWADERLTVIKHYLNAVISHVLKKRAAFYFTAQLWCVG